MLLILVWGLGNKILKKKSIYYLIYKKKKISLSSELNFKIMNNSWKDFNLHPYLVETIEKTLNFTEPTLIQKECLKYNKSNYDIIAASKTGSGKTFCYLLPLLSSIFEKFDKNPEEYLKENRIEGLILLPARELAIQVYKEFEKFTSKDSKYKFLRPGLIIGGLAKEKQFRILKRKPKIIIATPGRLLDLVTRENVFYLKYLSMINYLILDEIDRIIDLGQFTDIKQIFNFFQKTALTKSFNEENFEEKNKIRETIEFNGQQVEVYDENEKDSNHNELTEGEIKKAKFLQTKRKTILISATLTKLSGTSRMVKNKKFKKMLKKKLKKKKKKKKQQKLGKNKISEEMDPKLLEIVQKVKMNNKLKIVDLTKEKEGFLPKHLKIIKISCPTDQKINYLDYLLSEIATKELVLIFVNSINAAKKLKSILTELSYNATNIHSHMRQAQRIQKLEQFQKFSKRILISTDLASRGLDIKKLDYVIHYHTPRDLDTFVHRSGRTARCGAKGSSFVLTDPHDHARFVKFQKDLGNVERMEILPSEAFKREDLVKRACEIEREQFSITKKEKEKSWIKKVSKDVGLDYEDFQDEGVSMKEKEIIKKKKELKNLRGNFKNLKRMNRITISKKYSSFISPVDIALINENLKRLKKA